MKGFTTKALHTYYKPNGEDGAIIPPLHLTTTFKFGNKSAYDYSRSGNPTRKILEKTIAALDGNKYGLAFSSGSTVLATVTHLVEGGEAILFSTDAYSGTYRYIVNVAGKQGLRYRSIDLTDLHIVEKTLKEIKTKLIWVETPTNPLLKVADIKRLSILADKYRVLLVVDNTFATPIVQQPAELGADIVVYSTTKYMNGHSDSIGGALTTSNNDLFIRLKFLQNAIGAIMSPFDSWLTLRGLRTLELRMNRHVENAVKVAAFLDKHPKIKKVYYPGLFTGEQGRIVRSQMKAPGAMMSIEIKDKYDVQKFLKKLEFFPLAKSLGGVESLIDHPASMTHASIPKAEREKIGLSDGLLRVSVGIENSADLIADLKQALSVL
ncbi:cystathionine gamma-synthase [Candidatus Roizmanbacteria bacterium CG_4_10_14_0_8_um_filter_39_9]|uniref:Cystathionine gamma-synthase n=1 Tax=Candidatus Roizmanbacteria bacterium CG_4_10_14_0_8_um_filter_39_9 TaxID=1974829 RepID=A0A2M7QDH2_9BACT|nr:MAG: cystathionine gamma-synthase [Candidatus Roizmanbacteria bacterium CG_4_10_14_0_8_um_filter_39_9]